MRKKQWVTELTRVLVLSPSYFLFKFASQGQYSSHPHLQFYFPLFQSHIVTTSKNIYIIQITSSHHVGIVSSHIIAQRVNDYSTVR